MYVCMWNLNSFDDFFFYSWSLFHSICVKVATASSLRKAFKELRQNLTKDGLSSSLTIITVRSKYLQVIKAGLNESVLDHDEGEEQFEEQNIASDLESCSDA